MMNGIGFSRQNLEPSRSNLGRLFFGYGSLPVKTAQITIAAPVHNRDGERLLVTGSQIPLKRCAIMNTICRDGKENAWENMQSEMLY